MEVQSRDITWRDGRAFTMASDIGLRAGNWPSQLDVISGKSGNVAEFEKIAGVHKHGELQGYRYVGRPNGKPIYLMVFND